MKKYLLLFPFLCFLTAPQTAVAADNTQVTPFLVSFSSVAASFYVVGGATTTTASMAIHASSISFTTTGGLYPGTTQYVLTDTNKDTLAELKTYLMSVATTTAGAEGGIVVSFPTGAYENNVSVELTVSTFTSIKGASAAKTAYLDRQVGFTKILDGGLTGWGKRYHVTGLNASATFTSGTTYLNVRDGSGITDTQLLKHKLTTAVDAPVLWIPAGGEFATSADQKAMRFEVVGSSWVTDGYINAAVNRR